MSQVFSLFLGALLAEAAYRYSLYYSKRYVKNEAPDESALQPNEFLHIATLILGMFMSFHSYNTFGVSLNYAIGALFMVTGLVILWVDQKHQVIPDEVNLLIFISAVILYMIKAVESGQLIFDPLFGSLLSGGLLLLIGIFGVMGGGDIKYMFAAGLILGTSASCVALYAAFITGGVGATVYLILRKKGLKALFPFGPYLFIGVWFSHHYSDAVIKLLFP